MNCTNKRRAFHLPVIRHVGKTIELKQRSKGRGDEHRKQSPAGQAILGDPPGRGLGAKSLMGEDGASLLGHRVNG